MSAALLGGRYRLGRCIGAGAMAIVHEAVHVELGAPVAVKLLRTEATTDPEMLARFRREGRAAAAVLSEHVARILDAGTDPVLGPFLVCERLEGEDLEARLAREGKLDAEVVADLGEQLARGLAAAHAAEIVHRDLKPANVFLVARADGALLAKILDFGVSKTRDDGPDGPLTAKGTALGTPQYMAPEQLEGVADLDGRADVWSLAAVLYECLCGVAPFADKGTYLDIMMSLARDRVEPIRERAPTVPNALASAIDDALERDRELRTPSAAALAERLQHALARIRGWGRNRTSVTLRRASVVPGTVAARRRSK